MSETSKIVVIIIIILFATSLLMGVAFARVASNSEANSVRDTAISYSQDIARLSSESQFYRDVAIAINQQDQEAAAEYLRRSQIAEEELLFRIRDLQRELEEEEEENRHTIIFTPGGY